MAAISALKTAKNNPSSPAGPAEDATLTADNTANQAAAIAAINDETTANASTSAALPNAATQLSRPPLKFIEIDPNQRLPLPTPPSDIELLKQAEELVYWAISSKHENSAANQLSVANTNSGKNTNSNNRNTAIEAARRHTLLTDLLSRKTNPTQLLYALHAVTTSNSGRDLDRLVTNPKLHAQLIHLIMRLDPFTPGVDGANAIRELQQIRQVEKREVAKERALLQQQQQQRQQQNQDLKQMNKKSSMVKIDQSAIRHKEQMKYIAPTSPFFRYQIADAYLHLIITLISSNSILSVSAVRAIWNLLTDFGGKWMEEAMNRVEERRKWRGRMRRRRIMMMMQMKKRRELEELKQQQCQNQMEKEMIIWEKDDGDTPLAKKQKPDVMESTLSSSTSTPAAAMSEKLTELSSQKEEENDDTLDDAPEGDRVVPGMSGLTVDFVKDVFFPTKKGDEGDNYADTSSSATAAPEETICSDRLASGRVHRLFLTLLNIFRLCPRSKGDLVREISNNFPHYQTCPPALYQWYSHICLQLLHLVPTMEGPIMSMFVDKALDMDVEIKIDDKGGVFLDSAGGNGDDEGVKNVNDSFLEVVADTSPMPTKRSFQYISRDSTISTLNVTSNSALDTDTTADNELDHINEIAERLDTLMTVLFEHIIQITTFSPDSLSEAMMAAVNARRMYRHLDEVFDKKVRTTDRSKFVQFVFFVLFGRENDALEAVGRLMAKREQAKDVKNESVDIDSLNHTDPLYRGFSAKLIDFFFNPSHAGDVPRQTAVCYLASFVSRATYVCPETVCECIAALLRWTEIYISAHESQKRKGSPFLRRSASSLLSPNAQQPPCEVHGLFYTSCQAAFYLMCFRGVEAIQYYRDAFEHRDDPDSLYADHESVDIGPQRWRFLCGHELQPLKYCLESVRLEFLHIADDLDLFLDQSVDDELPRKEEAKVFLDGLWNSVSKEGKQLKSPNTPARKRSTIISTAAIQEKKRIDGGVGGLGKGLNPLGSFFPFDPYLLQTSYQHIHPYYRNWEDCIPSSSLIDVDVIADEDGVDICADLSDVEEDEETDEHVDDGEEEEDDDDDDDDDVDDVVEDDHSEDPNAPPTTKPSKSLNGENFEMEFRRSRALSTGSQCSW